MMRTFGTLAAAFVLFFAVPGAAHAQTPTLLTGALPDAQSNVPPPAVQKPGLLRQRAIVLNTDVLQQVRAALWRFPRTPVDISVPAFADTPLTVTITKVQQTGHGSIEFLGTVKGDDLGNAAIVISNGLVAGSIHTRGHAYEIVTSGAGQYALQDVDRSAIRDEEGDVPVPVYSTSKAAEQSVNAALADDASTIDLLVVYTTGAKQQANNCATVPANCSLSAPILASIDLAVATTNQAYANSGVIQRVRLVGTHEEVGYTEAGGNLSTDLQHLSNVNATSSNPSIFGHPIPPDGLLDDVQTLRNSTGADVVSLWVKDTGSTFAGLGWLQDPISPGFSEFAYNVVVWDTATSNLTQPHEMGHNMGLHHDSFVDASATPTPYAHGYVDTTHRFRTVMAYNDQCAATAPGTQCSRITGFSSPLFSSDGALTGDASNADASRLLNESALTVANFRTSVATTGTLAFRNAIVQTNEGAGTVLIPVARLGGASGTASVHWATTAGNAINGTDFTNGSGTLNWAAGDGADQNISVPVLQDGVADGEKTFTVTLSSATGAVLPTTGNVATVKIADDEPDVFPPGCTDPSGWTTPGGNVGWYAAQGTATEGSCSFRSHNVAPAATCPLLPTLLPFDTAQTQYTGTFFGGNITFDARVSSYAAFGCLQLSIDGSAKTLGSNQCAGPDHITDLPGLTPSGTSNDTGWQHFSIPVTAGAHTVTLNYQIPCVTDGDNAAYVDNLSMPAGPSLTMASSTASVAEGAGSAQVQVNRLGPSAGAVSVNYTFADGTAVNNTNYTGTPGTLNWADGDTTPQFIPVTIIPDSVVNTNRTFTVTLSGPGGGAGIIAPASSTVTIVNDDSTLQFSAATASAAEGASATLTVTRTGSATNAASVTWTAADGTAVAGTNYGTLGNTTPPTGTLNWAASDAASKTIVIPILQDHAVTGNQAFTVTLSAPTGTGAGLGTTVVSTVTETDNTSGIVFLQPSYQVGEAGPAISIPVHRIGSSTGAIGVTWTTADGTAVAGTRFGTLGSTTQKTGTLSWTSGDVTDKTITVGPSSTVPVINDTIVEAAQAFTINLSNPTGGAALGPQSNTSVSIVDDDSVFAFDQPTISVHESGPNVTLNVTRTGNTSTAATVMFATSAGTATATTDYTTTSGTLSFAAGVTTKPITIGSVTAATPHIPVINDALIEGNETFTVTLSAPTGSGHLGTPASSLVTIISDNTGIAMGAATRTVAENAGSIDVQVQRLGPANSDVSVNYTFTNGTAINNTHYTGTPGTLTWIGVDASPKIIHVPITDDSVVNTNRTFTVTLSGAVGITLGSPASTVVTIADDDNNVQFSSATSSVTEGSSASLSVTRTGGTANPASVVWTASDGTAIAGTDYGVAGPDTPPSGTLNWGAGDGAAKTIPIATLPNGIPQGARVFTVTLSSPTGATLGTTPTKTVTINDNDNGFVLSAPTYSILENAGNLTVTVNRLGAHTAAASVKWTTANGTAVAGARFGTSGSSTQKSGTLSWAAGDGAAKTFVVPIINNAAVDGDVTFTISLNTPSSGSTLGNPATATVTIVDEDIPPDSELTFSQPKYVVMENAGTVTVTVNRTAISGPFTRSASVNYATVAGTATATADYTAKSGPLNWGPGQSGGQTITVPITNDSVAESPETFTVTLSSASPGTRIGTPNTTTVLIVDDDEVFPHMGAFPVDWVTPGTADAGWMVSNDPGAFEGVFSLRSEPITDGQVAQTQLAGTFSAGNVSFRVRISSEANFDFLKFYIDGIPVPGAQWSGTSVSGWTAFTTSTPLTPAFHTLTWSYEKDGSASLGSDAAWIDAVTVPPYTP